MDNYVEKHFDSIANDYDYYKAKNKYYYDNLKLLLKDLISSAKEKSILECGCGTGDILSYLMPNKGAGVDISENMINIAKEKHKDETNLFFIRKNIEQEVIDINWTLDYVLMIDILEHLKNPILVLENIKKIMKNNTQLIIVTANKNWAALMYILEKLKLKMPEGEVRWFSLDEIINLLNHSGLQVIRSGYRLLIPVHTPFSNIINNNFYNNKFIKNLGLIQFVVAKITK